MNGSTYPVYAWKPRGAHDTLDRRDARRFEILGRLHGRVVSLDLDVSLREISLGGLSMDSDVPFPIDAIHEFRIAMGDGTPVIVRGQVIYSQPSTDGAARRYLTGVRFLDDDADSPVGDLIDQLS